jgi:ABC-2 type transport system permease protein
MSNMPFVTKKIAKRENGLMRFLVLVRKELATIWADKQSLAIIFLLPILAMFAVGATKSGSGGSSTDMFLAGREATIGVVNLDHSVGEPRYILSEEFIKVLALQSDTTLINYSDVSAADVAVYQEHVIGYIVIHNGFEFNVSAHLPAFVEFYYDSIYILSQALIAVKVNDAIQDFKIKFNYTLDTVTYETVNVWNVPSPVFDSFTMIVTITLMASGLMLACQSVVGDNPIQRVALSPSRKFEIISAKIAGYTILEMMQSAVLILVPMIFFNLKLPGNFFTVWFFSIFISYAGVSMGTFMSTIAKTKLQGSQFFLLCFMVLFILGSGIFIQGIDKIFPLGYSEEGVALAAFKDWSIVSLWPNIWPQIIYGTIFYIAAWVVLRLQKGTI